MKAKESLKEKLAEIIKSRKQGENLDNLRSELAGLSSELRIAEEHLVNVFFS